jgi:hypothetical protein
VAESRALQQDGGVFILGLVMDFFAWLFGELLGGAIAAFLTSDSATIVDDEVQGAVMAKSGRVHNVEREWIAGKFALSPGHMRFYPGISVSGAREIAVLALRSSYDRENPPFNLGWKSSAHLVLTTDEGELHWVIPLGARGAAKSLLFPRDRSD